MVGGHKNRTIVPWECEEIQEWKHIKEEKGKTSFCFLCAHSPFVSVSVSPSPSPSPACTQKREEREGGGTRENCYWPFAYV